MKRNLVMVLMGASLLVPMDGSAQRTRDGAPRAAQPAPITVTSGRLAPNARIERNRRVVYNNYRGSRRVTSDRFRVRIDWGRERVTFRHRARNRVLNPARLVDVLGRRTVERVRDAGRRAGLRGALRGHWEDTRRRGTVLVVTVDRVEVAEFLDYNGDGFIDEAYLIGAGRGRWVASRW